MLNRAIDYFSLVPEQYRGRTVIAGGAAADFEKASDVDLWYFLPREHFFYTGPDGKRVPPMDKGIETALMQFEFEMHLQSLGFVDLSVDILAIVDAVFSSKGTYEKKEIIDIGGKFAPSYMNDDQVAVSFNIWPDEGKKAQVMFVTHAEVDDLIAGFDISAHMVWMGPDGDVWHGPESTPTDVMPVVVNANAIGGGTPARLLRIAKRYGFDISPKEAVSSTREVDPNTEWEEPEVMSTEAYQRFLSRGH